jgi:sugar transferase (PEP-CTERM/EpsH1 system associated)
MRGEYEFHHHRLYLAALLRSMNTERPLIAHVVHHFGVGGLENGVVNLINHLSRDRWRHAVISLTATSESFRRRVARDDVLYASLGKRPGHLVWYYPTLFRLFREMQPAIVHTRNLAALEASVPAWVAGGAARVHGEHGWDMHDLTGSRRRYRLVRRLYRPFVQKYVALSRHIAEYLQKQIHVPAERIAQIYNGVDTERFSPAAKESTQIRGCPFGGPDCWIVGTVGRMEGVKDQRSLALAFRRAVAQSPAARQKMRLVVVGDGPLRASVTGELERAGVGDLCWLPGERDDIPDVLRGLDCFVLPSLAEGISNTILEAMSSGLPVIATRVGGNVELVEDDVTGRLVPSGDSDAMANAMLSYFREATLARDHGKAARRAAENKFSLSGMISGYEAVYEEALSSRHRGYLDKVGAR